jgi:hypothetical protein
VSERERERGRERVCVCVWCVCVCSVFVVSVYTIKTLIRGLIREGVAVIMRLSAPLHHLQPQCVCLNRASICDEYSHKYISSGQLHV